MMAKPTKRPPVEVLEMWRRRFQAREVTMQEIAELLDVWPRTVQAWWMKAGLVKRYPVGGNRAERNAVCTKRRALLLEMLKEVPDLRVPDIQKRYQAAGFPAHRTTVWQDMRAMKVPPAAERLRREVRIYLTEYPDLTRREIWQCMRNDGYRLSIHGLHSTARRLIQSGLVEAA